MRHTPEEKPNREASATKSPKKIIKSYLASLKSSISQKFMSSLTFHSNMTTAVPEAAPEPAIPTKLTLPMLLAKRDIPIYKN